MHRRDFFDFDSCIATFSDELNSPVGVLFLQRYQSVEELQNLLTPHKNALQCIVAASPIAGLEPCCVPFGQAQHPRLADYADGVDTLQFLLEIQKFKDSKI
jgi:hypothetical protein